MAGDVFRIPTGASHPSPLRPALRLPLVQRPPPSASFLIHLLLGDEKKSFPTAYGLSYAAGDDGTIMNVVLSVSVARAGHLTIQIRRYPMPNQIRRSHGARCF